MVEKTALANSPYQLVTSKIDGMIKVLPGKETARRRFRQAAISISMAPGVMNCTPMSVLKCIYQCALLDLIPDPVQQLAAIVPFKNQGVLEATLIIEYRGLVNLAKRADPTMFLEVGTVYENDDYILERGLKTEFKVTKEWWEKGLDGPGRPMFSYSISSQGKSERQLVVIPRQEGEKIGKASKAGMRTGTPWKEHFERMCEKTCIRRASRTWILDPEKEETRQFREALEVDDASPDELPDVPDADEILGKSMEEGMHGKAEPVTQPPTASKKKGTKTSDPITDEDTQELAEITTLKLVEAGIMQDDVNRGRVIHHVQEPEEAANPNPTHGHAVMVINKIKKLTKKDVQEICA